MMCLEILSEEHVIMEGMGFSAHLNYGGNYLYMQETYEYFGLV